MHAVVAHAVHAPARPPRAPLDDELVAAVVLAAEAAARHAHALQVGFTFSQAALDTREVLEGRWVHGLIHGNRAGQGDDSRDDTKSHVDPRFGNLTATLP